MVLLTLAGNFRKYFIVSKKIIKKNYEKKAIKYEQKYNLYILFGCRSNRVKLLSWHQKNINDNIEYTTGKLYKNIK